MSALPSFASQTITVLRAPLVDDHGDMVPDWSQPPTEIVVTDVVLAPPRSRSVQNVHEVTTEVMLFAPIDTDIHDTDRVRYNGLTYAIRGEVLRYEAGVLDHVEAYLTTVTAVA